MEDSMTSGSLDRRSFRRSGIGEHGIVSARVRPGRLVLVIDVSAGGTLVEISQRLLPGAAVDLQFATAHRRTNLRGRVLRCAVTRLRPTAVSYRAAIAFDRQWPGFVESEWSEYPVPTGEAEPAPAERVGSTQDVA
jgi:PilZ domain-containing protein